MVTGTGGRSSRLRPPAESWVPPPILTPPRTLAISTRPRLRSARHEPPCSHHTGNGGCHGGPVDLQDRGARNRQSPRREEVNRAGSIGGSAVPRRIPLPRSAEGVRIHPGGRDSAAGVAARHVLPVLATRSAQPGRAMDSRVRHRVRNSAPPGSRRCTRYQFSSAPSAAAKVTVSPGDTCPSTLGSRDGLVPDAPAALTSTVTGRTQSLVTPRSRPTDRHPASVVTASTTVANADAARPPMPGRMPALAPLPGEHRTAAERSYARAPPAPCIMPRRWRCHSIALNHLKAHRPLGVINAHHRWRVEGGGCEPGVARAR